jgi:NAD(P)-dependent dehydrogenase (short-subunit alcohol dehydrogenase family)
MKTLHQTGKQNNTEIINYPKNESKTGKLNGKVAVITGGTEGIGLATAKLFVEEDAYVFITGRRPNELEEAVKAIGRNVTGVQGDVAKLADLDGLYETVGEGKGRIDIILANAGVGEFVPLGKISEEHFDKLFNINVKGALFTVQKGLPLMNDGGSIILTGSVASSPLLTPVRMGDLDLRNRIVMAPLTRMRAANPAHAPTELHVQQQVSDLYMRSDSVKTREAVPL